MKNYTKTSGKLKLADPYIAALEDAVNVYNFEGIVVEKTINSDQTVFSATIRLDTHEQFQIQIDASLKSDWNIMINDKNLNIFPISIRQESFADSQSLRTALYSHFDSIVKILRRARLCLCHIRQIESILPMIKPALLNGIVLSKGYDVCRGKLSDFIITTEYYDAVIEKVSANCPVDTWGQSASWEVGSISYEYGTIGNIDSFFAEKCSELRLLTREEMAQVFCAIGLYGYDCGRSYLMIPYTPQLNPIIIEMRKLIKAVDRLKDIRSGYKYNNTEN